VPARHASPPGNRLKAKPMADGRGGRATELKIADCGFEIAQNRVRRGRQWKFKVHPYFTQITSLHQTPFNLKSKI
jgi:hypothetical protein